MNIPSSSPTVKPLLRALKGEKLAVPPVWLMRQAGRYLPEYRALRETVGGFLDLCLTSELAAEVTLQPVRRFALDAGILFSDILVVPYALGQALEYRDGEGPVLEPVRSAAAVSALSDAGFRDRVAPVWRTVERVKGRLPPEVALIGFAGSPWTVASYMIEGGTSRDFAAIKYWAFSDPHSFGDLIDRLVDATIVYLDGQIRAGAEVVQLFDSWAGVLPEAAFRQWVIEPTKKIVSALRTIHAQIPIIGFPRGAGLMYQRLFRRDRRNRAKYRPNGVTRRRTQNFTAAWCGARQSRSVAARGRRSRRWPRRRGKSSRRSAPDPSFSISVTACCRPRRPTMFRP